MRYYDAFLNALGVEVVTQDEYQPADVLAKLLEADGADSGLDADLLDGQQATAFAVAGHDHAGVYQPADADLSAIAALSDTGGYAKRTAADTWTITMPSAADVGITASLILSELLTVDADESGLNASTLQGQTYNDIYGLIDSYDLAYQSLFSLIQLYEVAPSGLEAWAPPIGTGFFTVVTDTIYAFPLAIPNNMTVNKVGVRIKTAATGNCRVGIYSASNLNYVTKYPQSLIKDFGTVSTSTTGPKILTSTQSLSPGLYWAVALVSGTAELYTNPKVVFNDVNLSLQATGISKSLTYGALPSTFPAGAALCANTIGITMRRSI